MFRSIAIAVFAAALVRVAPADNSRLVAHRADNSRFPQNTVAAIESAVHEGAGIIEIDIRKCKTGELLVICEPDLAETTDGTGIVSEVTFEYIRSLSACAPKKFGDRFRGKFKIPTLEEAFAAIPENGPYINCHCTDGTHHETARLIMKQQRQNRAYIGVLGYHVKRLKRAFPEVMLCNLERPGMTKTIWTKEQHWNYAKKTIEWGCSFVQPIGVKNAPPAEVVDYLHKNGVKVAYFKCDDPKERRRIFSETDVDFIFTDRLPATKTGSDFCWNGHFEELRGASAYGWRSVNGFVFRRGAGREGGGGAELLSHNMKKPAYIVNEFSIRGGRSYEVSAWIRTEGVKGSKSGAMIYAEVKDGNGKYIEGAEIYPRGSTGTKGWTRYSGVVNAPYQAEKMEIGAMLFAGAEGRAWVDDFSCVMLPEKPVKGVVVDAYRNQTDRKTVNISAVLGLADGDVPEMRGSFSLLDANGKVVRMFAAEILSCHTASVSADVGGVPPGKYTVMFRLEKVKGGVLAGEARCALELLSRLPVRKVYIDEHQRTVVEGKPFFPLGMYSYNIGEEDVKMYVEAPFNCIMSYRVPTDGQMDTFSKYGIRAIVGFSNYFYGLAKEFKTMDDEVSFYTNSINRLKNHPATLAWYLHDEIPLSYLPRLMERRRLAHELDPDHPTWGVLCLPYNTELLLDTFDICGNDPYPVYHDEKRDLFKSWEWARLSRSQTRGARGIWQVPQAFTWANYQNLAEVKGRARLPTFDEMRKMAYQQIAGGANGLIFYSFHDVLRTRKDEPKNWQSHWDGIKRLATEIARRQDIWLAVEPYAISIPEPPKDMKVSVRTWRKGGIDHVLVSSGEGRTLKFSLPLPEIRAALKPIEGSRASMADNRASIELELPPYGFSFFSISR